MSILIKNMKLPDKDHFILVKIDSNGDVFTAYDSGRTKLTQYKVSLVPTPHGRLIDTDAVSLEDGPYEYDEWCKWALTQYQDAPTIIEAEE